MRITVLVLGEVTSRVQELQVQRNANGRASVKQSYSRERSHYFLSMVTKYRHNVISVRQIRKSIIKRIRTLQGPIRRY